MSQQLLIIDGASLTALLTSYYDGLVPLDAKLLEVGVSQFLNRWVGLLVESAQWPAEADLRTGDGKHPLHLRYEGGKMMSWSKSDDAERPTWHTDFEVPK